MTDPRTRRVRWPVLLAALALVAAACGGGDDEAAGDGTTTTRARVTTTTGPPVIAPLTGLEDPTGTSAARGPLWVKIDNVPLAVRPPQAGIEVADIVYEEPVEGATRFLALFHSTLPERIGPVRSTRFVDPGIVWHIGGLYVFSGGTAPKVDAIRNAPVQTIDENALVAAGAQIRDPGIRRPHNLFFPPETLWAWGEVQDRTPPEPVFTFLGAGDTFAGDPASVVEVPTLSRARYTWDAAGGGWKREALQRSRSPVEPHLAESGEQVAPANLVVQVIGRIRDNADDRFLVVGEGDVWVCAQGRCTQGRWSRPDLESSTTFSAADGTPIAFAPGTTWIHLVNGGPTITP